MTLVSSGVSVGPDDQHLALLSRPHHFLWPPRWLQRRREADELARWTSQVVGQWNDTMDNIGLAHRGFTAARIPLMVGPQVQSVDPGPPVTLLVLMLRGQIVDDFRNKVNRIAAGMDVPMVRITPCGHRLINVVLLGHEH